MGIFRDLQRAAANFRARKQAKYYGKLRRDAKLAGLQKAKLERIQAAKKEKQRLQAEVDALRPKKKRGTFKPIGDLKKLTAGMPTDAELNKAVFGSDSPKLPDDISRLNRGPSSSDLNKLSKDIFQ